MGRKKGSGLGLVPVTWRITSEQLTAIDAWALERDLTQAEAARLILQKALETLEVIGEVDAEEQGYLEGVRRGAREFQERLREMMKDLWK